MTTKIAGKINMQINIVDEQITSRQDEPIASTTETRAKNYSRD
jgi:hypothetical protein